MRFRRLLIAFTSLLFLLAAQPLILNFSDSGVCLAQTKSLTSMKLKDPNAIGQELQKAGISLSPEEIQKGKELLDKSEKTEKAEKTDSPKIIDVSDNAKQKTEYSTVVEPAKEISLFNRTRQIGKFQDISADLKPFGYDFFHGASVKVLTDRKDIPVPLDYVIGPGDQINILLWGRISSQLSLTVDRDGKITLPELGPVPVAGLTFDQMSKRLITKAEQIVGTNIDISMGSTKAIPVFVLGDVERPGAYTIGSLSTITDALMLARGPSAIGSMRRVELRRKDRVVARFDLYDLFLKGDKSQDAVLQAGDVVFVPVTGPLVGVAGNVKRPAIYELKDKFDLYSVLHLAGGIIPSAYTHHMQVERIVKNEKQIVIDINDKKLELAKSFVIQDADLIKVFSIVDTDDNAVYLNGNVKRPGKYAYKTGMRIKDILSTTDDLQPEAFFDYALIKRESAPNREIVLLPFSLGKLLLQNDTSFNYELAPKDQIFIFHRDIFEDRAYVTVGGEIRGTVIKMVDREISSVEIKTVDKEIRDTEIKTAGREIRRPEIGTMPGGIRSTEIKTYEESKGTDRQDSGRDRPILAELKDIKEALGKDERLYIYTSKIEEIEDEISSSQRPTPGALSYLQIELEKIGRPDISERLKRLEKRMQVVRKLQLTGNMKVRDAVMEAGGLTPNASMEQGEIIRQHAKNEFRTTYFNVARAMKDDPRDNLLLQDGDAIVIHSIWEKNPRRSVFIAGDVTNPGTYQYTENMTVRDLVFKSGNVLDSAYLDEAEITSVKIADGRLGQLTHRSINLRKALEGDQENNVSLAPNDRLLVKQIADYQKVRIVTLTGQVSFPGKYPIRRGEKLSHIIERVGGFTPYAYMRGAYFTRMRVRDVQQKGLTELADRMERELFSAGAAQLSSAVSQEAIAALKLEVEQKQKLIQTLRQTKATGRMTIYLADAETLRNSEVDFELEDGDTLDVPEKNSVVNVLGSVMSQGSLLYSDRMSYQDYIDATGGYSDYANAGNVFVLKVDGSARKVSKNFIGWNSSRARWEMTGYGGETRLIEPGDTIVVPEKTDRIAWLREIKDMTQILMNVAVAAGVVIALF